MATTAVDESHEASTSQGPRRLWPWALLSALLSALVLPLLLAAGGLADAWYLATTVVCAILGYVVALALGRRPRLRVGLLAGGVLVGAGWATWCYLDNLYRWPPGMPGDGPLPWYVSNIPGWAVVAQPLAIAACAVLAVVALVRLARHGDLRGGRWTVLLCAALLVCLVAGVQVLSARAYAA